MKETSAMLTEAELVAWGERIGEGAEPPLFLALRGDLGAGKSTLARAIARGAGVEGPVPSPTFNLLFRYETPRGVALAHLDLYRLEDPEEVWDLGWGELPGEGEIALVEWPERAEALLPEPRWEVEIEETGDDAVRRVTARPVGDPGALPGFVGAER
jgi:tRNA threonylcarbamoyladenosine biosynthesis protein TsaE